MEAKLPKSWHFWVFRARTHLLQARFVNAMQNRDVVIQSVVVWIFVILLLVVLLMSFKI